MKRRKGISPAITTLVLIGIALAVGALVSYIIISQTRSVATRGATISLTIDARDLGGGYTSINIQVKNLGPEDVVLNSIELYKSSSSSPIWTKNPGASVKSGGTWSKTYVVKTNLSTGSKIMVAVSGVASISGTPVSAHSTAEIMP